MKILLCGSTIFCLAFFVHLIVWRIRIPGRQTKVLKQIFAYTLLASLFVIWCLSAFILKLGLFELLNFFEYLHISLFYLALTLAYIVTYSGMEVDSPSLVMTMKIAAAGTEGLSKEEFDESLPDDILVKPRVRDLVRDEMVTLNGEKHRITTKGVILAQLFIFYRKLLGITLKGG